MGEQVLFGLGANIGRPIDQLREALTRLSAVGSIDRVSHVYRSDPVGLLEQPDFYNIVCSGTSTLDARDLLTATQQIEQEMGRVRSIPNAPRTIDIDLLAYGDLVIELLDLVLPHPRMHLRSFVMLPLAEIAPRWMHPVLGISASDLVAGTSWEGATERLGEIDKEH